MFFRKLLGQAEPNFNFVKTLLLFHLTFRLLSEIMFPGFLLQRSCNLLCYYPVKCNRVWVFRHCLLKANAGEYGPDSSSPISTLDQSRTQNPRQLFTYYFGRCVSKFRIKHAYIQGSGGVHWTWALGVIFCWIRKIVCTVPLYAQMCVWLGDV